MRACVVERNERRLTDCISGLLLLGGRPLCDKLTTVRGRHLADVLCCYSTPICRQIPVLCCSRYYPLVSNAASELSSFFKSVKTGREQTGAGLSRNIL